MPNYKRWEFPNLPPEAMEQMFQHDRQLVIIGVIGKSAFSDCNKMAAFNILQTHPAFTDHQPKEGQIQFYYKQNDNKLFVHFETTYDAACAEEMFRQEMQNNQFGEFNLFSQRIRTKFARVLLFAIHICHLIVFVEPNEYFDSSLVDIFKSLKIIRERHVCKFVPKLLKNTVVGSVLGKQGRLCSPRFLFLFESLPDGFEKSKDLVTRLELEMEDNVYKILRNENVLTNTRGISLFSIPANKRFVFFNTNAKLREDPIESVCNDVNAFIHKNNNKIQDDLEDYRPYKGFGTAILNHMPEKFVAEDEKFLKTHDFMDMIDEHVDDAFKTGFDDDLTRYKGRFTFSLLNGKTWFEVFKVLHKLFIDHPSNPRFEANDPDYRSYLETFNGLVNPDNEFFTACCDIGMKKAYNFYNNPTLTHYSAAFHKKMVEEAVALYMRVARGPFKEVNEKKLRLMCDSIWLNGKQQCEFLSLRGFPCIRPKHIVKDASEHSSGLGFISTCNCGRTQGRREDPYTLRQANYDYYEYMASNCHLCMKVQKYQFPVFQPSISDYRAAELDSSFEKLSVDDGLGNLNHFRSSDLSQMCGSQEFLVSQGIEENLSLGTVNELDKIDMENKRGCSEEEPVNELILQVKGEDDSSTISRQASTTEYLDGMVHSDTPTGLLPLFPSWSLCCVGASSLYSHSSGLMEHFQSGFLSGANFLLPWDVQVRLENPSSWAYDRVRHRRIGEVFLLKIFVGYEYECPRGHRFMMSAPDKILRSASGIQRDSGSKVVFNNMPLYFPCPCRFEKMFVAQLMRIHVVTPKAPVNVIVDPKVRVGPYTFTLGLPTPPKLSQSAYWILRLPYIYQGDEGPIAPPLDLNPATAISHGYLVSGMFGVTETEGDDSLL